MEHQAFTPKIAASLEDGLLIGQFRVCPLFPVMPSLFVETKSVRSSGSNFASILSILLVRLHILRQHADSLDCTYAFLPSRLHQRALRKMRVAGKRIV